MLGFETLALLGFMAGFVGQWTNREPEVMFCSRH